MDWPLRCARCRTDLTGEAILQGRVSCPKCRRRAFFPTTPANDRRREVRWLLLVILTFVVLPLSGAASFVIYFWLSWR